MNDSAIVSFNDRDVTVREVIDKLKEQLHYATAQRAAFKSLIEIWENDILNIAEVIADLEASFPDEVDDCQHEWIDARNSNVVSGYYCRLCSRIRPGDAAQKVNGSE